MMDAGLMARDYRAAKNKKQQIEIFRQLNECSREDVIAALVAGGIRQQELPRNRARKSGAEIEAAPTQTDATTDPSGREPENAAETQREEDGPVITDEDALRALNERVAAMIEEARMMRETRDEAERRLRETAEEIRRLLSAMENMAEEARSVLSD